MFKRLNEVRVHYIAKGKNQPADDLASDAFKDPMVGAMKLKEPKL